MATSKMDLPVDVTGFDMNNSVNLAFYTQLIRFRENLSATETFLYFPDNAQQRMIQSWAHELGLAFEFTLATQAARVVKTTPAAVSTNYNTENIGFLGFDSVTDIGLDTSWPACPEMLSDLTGMNAGPSLDDVEGIGAHAPFTSIGTFQGAETLSIHAKKDEATTDELDVPLLLAKPTKRINSQRCCAYAYSLEHTVITALSTLNHDITGTREDCCRITEKIWADNHPDIDEVVKAYISSRKSRNNGGGLLGNAFERHSIRENRLSINSSSSPGLVFLPEVETRANTQKQFSPEPEFATPARIGGDRSELDQASCNGEQGHQDRPSLVGSVTGVKHERGRKRVRNMFSRRPSLQSPASSTFQEFVFDSRSPRIGSPASGASEASGRRGPLSTAANAAAKAVKAIRACWRCKFLRKTCSLDTPCLACPKTTDRFNGLSWSSVACRRGTFSEEMGPLRLCLRSDSQADLPLLDGTPGDTPSNISSPAAGEEWGQLGGLTPPANAGNPIQEIYGRAIGAERMPDSEPGPNGGDQANEWSKHRIESREKVLNEFRETARPRSRSACQQEETNDSRVAPVLFRPPLLQVDLFLDAAVTPLNECIDSIIQEAFLSPYSKECISTGGEAQWAETLLVLRSAALHQASMNSVAQSLICLRSSFEALAVVDTGFLKPFLHTGCSKSACAFDCITKLTLDLKSYLDELSRVFFKKENMRSKESWWLSAFYSFRIQAIVRRALLKLPATRIGTKLMVEQYLYLPIRLFGASCGSYDPLMRDYASPDLTIVSESSTVSCFRNAQLAVRQTEWASKGIASSVKYLKQLFEDNGDEFCHLFEGSSLPEKAVDSQPIAPGFDAPLSVAPCATPSLATPQYQKQFNANNQLNVRPAWTPTPRPYRASSLSSVESVNDFPTEAHADQRHSMNEIKSNSDDDINPSRGLMMDPDFNQTRRRPLIACEVCRSRKSRCNGSRPTCRLCKELGAECIYREPGIMLDAGDKLILESLTRIEGLIQANLSGQFVVGRRRH